MRITFRSLCGAAFICALTTAAQATSITIQSFTYLEWSRLTGPKAVTENFEDQTRLNYKLSDGTQGGAGVNGELQGALTSRVGQFSSLGGKGTGSTCRTLDRNGDNECRTLALQFDPAVNGQGNILPVDGNWSLNTADTLGMLWNVSLSSGGFRSLVFGIRDAADAGAKVTVNAAGKTRTLSGLKNDNRQLIFIDFGQTVTSASVTLTNSRTNDAFTLDGAAVNAVPLPTPALLLLGGIGSLALMRRRRSKRAQH